MRGYEGAGERLLVPGMLRGFRAWRYDSSENTLSPLHYNMGPWTVPGTTIAACPNDPMWLTGCDCDDCFDDDDNEAHGSDFAANPAPVESCTCGIYAAYKPGTFAFTLPRRWERFMEVPRTIVYGSILASGKVLLGETGFRAQKAEIEGLYGLRARWAARRLGLPWFSSEKKYVKKHPADGLMHLERES